MIIFQKAFLLVFLKFLLKIILSQKRKNYYFYSIEQLLNKFILYPIGQGSFGQYNSSC